MEKPKSAKPKIEPKTYLGDGLYCEDQGNMLRLYVNDGEDVVHEVYLEPAVLQEFIVFARERGYPVDGGRI